MGKISERIKGTVEDYSKSFGDRLKGWLVGILSFGFEVFMDVLGRSFAPKLTPFIEKLEQAGDIPPELKPILDEIKNPTGEVGAILAQSAGGALVGGALGGIMDALFLRFSYSVNSLLHPKIANEQQLLAFWLRGFYDDDKLKEELRKLGADDSAVSIMKELSKVRLNPETVARLWMRDKPKWEHLWKDLEDSGVTNPRILALKEAAHLMPTYQDVVNFMAHEVFEEDAVAKYGLDDEFGQLDLSWFAKVGVKPELAKQLWRNHWQHPAFREITELLHRGEITEDDVYEWYRLVEIPPHWRDKLTSISWDLPNRIELRMMARYGLVDKDFLVEQLKLVGLREDFRSIAADMMLAMGIRTDLSTRYSKGWLDADGVKAELDASGLSPEVADRMYMWIVKNTGEDRVAAEKNLTKSEIYKAIKKGAIPASQGVELIEDLGYARDEAVLLVEINVGVLEGSPENYQELKKATQLYRQAVGLEAHIPSEDIIQAEKDVKAAEIALAEAEQEKATPKKLTELREAVDEAKLRYHQLLSPKTD